MNKIEKNMYARFDGKIGKIIYICECEQCKARGYNEPIIEYANGEIEYVSCYMQEHLKASYNIIDLIKKGDYVNGGYVNEIINGKPFHDEDDPYYSYGWENEEIETIVTKEMMESVTYYVK